MPNIAQQAAKALAKVAAAYNKSACPCAYPRFAQLVGFDFHNYGVGPVGCHLTDIMIDTAVVAEGGKLKAAGEWQGEHRLYRCGVCGSEGELYSEQFNINLTVSNFKYTALKAKLIGAPAEDRIPIPNGFYGFQSADIARCATFFKEASIEEMTKYLLA